MMSLRHVPASFIGVTLASLLLASLWGCSRPSPVKQAYLLQTPAASPAAAAPRPSTLKVGTIAVAAPFRGRSMVYREGELKYESDFYNEFFVAPSAMLTEGASAWLAAAEKAILTGQVQNATTNGVTAQTAKSDSLPKFSVPEMILVDSGTFIMGCTGGHTEDWYGRVEDCQTNENPNHIVTLSSYKIGKFEVSQAGWKSLMGVNPSHHKDCDQCPVEEVSWNDVQEFLQKLNEQTGRHYQLPTEAQWEYAARGGKFSRGYLFAGSNEMPSVAWWGQKNIVTCPAGLKQPNELGIYDMSGNVWEWCSDWFADYDMISQTNPQGPLSGVARVVRGGSGRHEDVLPRVYTRNHVSPDECSNGIGFRLVLVP